MMQRNRLIPFILFFSFLTILVKAQPTVLEPGDIAVMGVVTDLSGCGEAPGSDEISFVCFKDITAFTNIYITDNGWEAVNPGFWGNTEGTLRLIRAGATIPAGTVITMMNINNGGGNWAYQVVFPDNNWIITNESNGAFDLQPGGDQMCFLQGGTWNNGGLNMATYGGDVIHGFNTLPVWAANGSTNQSNLHPDLLPCYHFESPSVDFFKYTDPLTDALQWDWFKRIMDSGNWVNYPDCASYAAGWPNYAGGYLLSIHPYPLGAACFDCDVCSGDEAQLFFHLPQGFYNVVYTDGTDTFYLDGVQDFHTVPTVIIDTTTFTVISVEEVGGCPLPDNFTTATINAPYNNPGTHGELWICPDYGLVPLANYLGPHDPGGTWIPPLDPMFGLYYSSYWGPGTYLYAFFYDPGGIGGGCPPDTATVTVYHITADSSTIEIGCDVNGTPYDITDDRLTVTLNFNGPGLAPEYMVTPLYFGVPTGSITPTTGMTGVTTTFYLDPGTATQNNLTLLVQETTGFLCKYKFPLPAPGWCSDPCDHDMNASIFGDEELCPNSCPDEPGVIDFEINGGHPQFATYTMDFSVTATGYPAWNFTGQEVLDGDQMEICVYDVPAPVFDPGSMSLILPKYLTGQYVTITLQNVYDKYECTAILVEEQVEIYIRPLPPISTTALTFCENEAGSVDLTEYDLLISTMFDVEWYDEDPLQGGNEIYNATTANLLDVVQLWALVSDGDCRNSIQVGLTILPVPDIDSIPPVEVCTGNPVVLQSLPIIDQNNTSAVYTFYSNYPLDSTTLLNPQYYIPADSTTIYLLATDSICFDTVAIKINVQDYPDFTLQGTPCDLLSNTYSVQFTSSADSIISTKGNVVNNPNGQDLINGIPNDSSVLIILLNASGLCRDTFLIVAPNCNCPFIPQPQAQPKYEICEGDAIPVLSVTVDPGLTANWYDVPSGGSPLAQNTLTYVPPVAVTDNYYAEAFDPSNNCYSIRTEIPFVVNPVADLQPVSDLTLCEGESINLNSLTPGVTNGVAGTGSWFNLSTNQPAAGTIQLQNDDAWYYLFHTNAGNCISSDTFNAFVNPLPELDLYSIDCDENTLTFDLLFTSNAENVNASAGTLNQIPGTDSFSVTGIPFDTDVIFDLVNNSTGCQYSFTQEAPDCTCPDLLQQTSSEVCSDDANIDLSAFVGFGVTGNWQLTSTPGGPNPAVLAGNNLQILDKDAGQYTLRFTRSVIIDNCVDTAFFTLTLHQSPSADAGTDFTACAPDDIVLSGNVSGSNVQFSWQTNGSGSLQNPNLLNTGYTPSLADITAGSVDFTLIASDQTGFCPSDQETITATIDGSAYFILSNGTETYCDTTDLLIDLDDFITFGTTGGHWFFPAGVSAPITGNSLFNPSDLTGGNYVVYYTTSNAVPPCENDTVGLNLIIQNCACPSVALSVPANALCSENDLQDLNDYLLTTELGTWSIAGTPPGTQPATINGSSFTTNNSDAGTYTLRFTLSNPVAGCDEFAEIELEVIATPSIQIISVDCADDLQSWEAVINSNAQLVINSAGTLTSLGGGQYLIENITLNTAMQITASNGSGLCTRSLNVPAPDCECTLAIGNLPDEISLCPGETFTLEADVTGGKGAVTQFWITGNDSLFQSTLEVSQSGIYHFVTVDELGCKEEFFVDVSIYEEMMADVSMTDVTCPGDKDGSITVHAIQGGNGPYFISVNGGTSQPISIFPFEINNLGAGNYNIEITDGFNCLVEISVPVQSASSERVDLGPDQAILVGDSLLISPVVSFTPDSFYWTGDIDILDPEMLINWVAPEEDKTLELIAIDDKGCIYSDDIKIRVLLTSSIYVPTIFTPNGDGANDLIAPLTDPSIIKFQYFQVFSRWGELIYSQEEFTPNQAGFGWDGTFHEKAMSPGVYVYRLKAINKRGQEYVQYGDLTLVR